MQNASASNRNCHGHLKQQISKVIIRLEIDDLNIKASSATTLSESSDTKNSNQFYNNKNLDDIINSSNKNIFEIFNYNCNFKIFLYNFILYTFNIK